MTTGFSSVSAVPSMAQQRLVQTAARALGRAGLVHAYGHCSVRLDETFFLVCAAMPMGIIQQEPGTVVRTEGPLPDGVLGEVRAHQAIYRHRPDVSGICRIMPPAVMALSTQSVIPKARHGLGAFFGAGPVLWDDSNLLRNDEAADALAVALGKHNAIVMRANGAIVAADSLEKAVTLSWFLEDTARVERDVRASFGDRDLRALTEDEITSRNTFSGKVVERMWAWMTAGDRSPE